MRRHASPFKISWIFPLSWTPCKKCNLLFRFEKGWVATHGDGADITELPFFLPVYACRGCFQKKHDFIFYLASLQVDFEKTITEKIDAINRRFIVREEREKTG